MNLVVYYVCDLVIDYVIVISSVFVCVFFFFKQKTAYEMRISDGSSDVCSSDLDAQLGDFIVDPLPAVDLGRIDAQSAKQVIFQKVREADRERQYEEFKDRASEIITGVVKSVEFGHIVVNLGRAEGVIRRDQQIPREQIGRAPGRERVGQD